MILGYTHEDTSLDFTGFDTLASQSALLGCTINPDTGIFHDLTHNLIFVAQGRIDNTLTLQSFVGRCASGPEFVYRAYLAWGKNCPSKLLGDWLFVAYDTQSGEVFMARDQNGIGDFYYKETANGLLFSSTIARLVQTSKALNEMYVLSVLGFWHYKNIYRETIFKGVYKLLPGHTLTFQNNSVRIEKYWFPETVSQKHYRNTQDYADELLEISKEAIRCRIPDSLRVASMLSGGFDSGTVSSLTAELLGDAPLVTLSHVPLYDRFYHLDTDKRKTVSFSNFYNNKFHDESEYIDAIAASQPNIRSIKLKSAHISPLDGIEKFVKVFNTVIINGANANWLIDIYEQASAMGFEVLFSGQFGNVALSYRGVKDLLPMPPGFNALKHKVIKPMVRNLLEYRHYKKRLEGNFLNKHLFVAYKINLDVLINRTGFKSVFGSTQEEIINLTFKSYRNRLLGLDSPFKMQILDPTADIRIVEHCLSIPNQFFFNEKGENKQVIRKMMAGRLPDKVLHEQGKGVQGSDVFLRILDEIERVEGYFHRFEKNPTFRHFVDTPKLGESIRLIKEQKMVDIIVINNLLKTLMLGIFLEHNGF